MKLAGWLEDFDPTASGSRTSTRQRLARGLRPIHPGLQRGPQRGNTTGKQNGKQNGKIKAKKIEKLYL